MLEVLNPFPTLHPLVVHAPIVLLPLTPLLLIAAWAARSLALEWTALILLALGWMGTLLASRIFHPHTDVMTMLAQDTLRIHELWADWSQGLGAATLLFLVLCLVLRFSKIRVLIRGVALGLALATAVAVTLAGHYGALLTHVYGVKVEKGS